MKKALLLTALSILISGCSSTPKPKPVVQQPLFEKMQKMSTEIVENGGLSAVGIGESKSLELALTKAKTRGRTELAQMLEAKIEALQKDFQEETGVGDDAEILAQFSSTAKVITSQQLAGSVAQELKYETIGDTVTAYALMVLDPQVIADQLAREKELYTRFRATQAFEELDQEIEAYDAYKAEQQKRMMGQ
jgi:hypothetical protein